MVKVIIVHCQDLGRDGQAQVLNLGSKKAKNIWGYPQDSGDIKNVLDTKML